MTKIITIHIKKYPVTDDIFYMDVIVKIHRAFNTLLPNAEVKRTVDGIVEILQSQQREVRHAKKHKRVGAQKAVSFPKQY